MIIYLVSAIYDDSRSSYGSTDWSKQTAALRANFADFMSKWLAQTSTNKTNVIGVSILGGGTEGFYNYFKPSA